MSKPVIILVSAQMGENIGTAARAMLNCGLTDLRLVGPRDGWPNVKAERAAVGAFEMMDEVKVFETTEQACADLTYVYATSARDRKMVKPVVTARFAATEAREKIAAGGKIGYLFGAERMGLVNDDVALADALLTVPLNPEFTSLNLAQAVLLVGYEWYQAGDATPPSQMDMNGGELATKEQVYAFFEHFERELDACGFLRNEAARPNMVRNLRNMWSRAELTEQEVRTLHGVVKELTTLRVPRK